MKINTVAFDLDGTLIDIDSAQAWLLFVMNKQVPGAGVANHICTQIMKKYDSGLMDMESYMRAWLQPISGLSLQELTPLAGQFIKQVVKPAIYPDALDKLAWHQVQGHHIVLVSASPELIVAPIAKYLGVKYAIGINVDMKEGKITQVAIPPYTFKEGKVTAVNQWLSSINQSKLDYAYSDSINDLPLLNMAQQAYCINPCPNLLQAANDNNWPVYQWICND